MVRSMRGPENPMEQPQHTSINQLQTLPTSMLQLNLNQNNQQPHYVTSMEKQQIYQDPHLYLPSKESGSNGTDNYGNQYCSKTQPTPEHSKYDQQRPCFEIPNSNFQAWLNTNHPQASRDNIQNNSPFGTDYVPPANNIESEKRVKQFNANCYVNDEGKSSPCLVHGTTECPLRWQPQDSNSYLQHKNILSSHLMQVI